MPARAPEIERGLTRPDPASPDLPSVRCHRKIEMLSLPDDEILASVSALHRLACLQEQRKFS